MCAAVGVMPVTVMLAVTVRSGFTSTVPVAVPVVVIGGTSCAPDNVTCWEVPLDAEAPIVGICEQLIATLAAPASAIVHSKRRESIAFMMASIAKSDCYARHSRRRTYDDTRVARNRPRAKYEAQNENPDFRALHTNIG